MGQGTNEGAIISASNIDKGVSGTFEHSDKEISYGEEYLHPLLFQDDILRATDNVESLQYGNDLIAHVMNDKLLNLNLDKSKFMIVGSEKVTKTLRDEVKRFEPTLNKVKIKESDSEKYLGDYFHRKGNSQSIITTVKNRYGKAIEAIVDIRNIVEDVRAEAIGAIKTGIEIYELSVIPFILFNSEVWDNIPKEAMNLLNKIHLTFLRMLLKTLSSTPIPALLWETGSLDMNARIVKRKLSFYHHVENMHEDSLAKSIANVQKKNRFPGLIGECKQLLRDYNIDDEEIVGVSKDAWKKKVRKAINRKFKENLTNEMKKYKKIDHEAKSDDEFELKTYFKSMKLEEARMRFSIECQMVPFIKFNFMNEKAYAETCWSCDFCFKKGFYYPDSMSHVLVCDQYKFLRNTLDIREELDQVKYFISIVKLRHSLNNMTVNKAVK